MTTNAEPWPAAGSVHDDLLAAKARVYDPSGLTCSRPVPEKESAAYGAYAFTVAGLRVRFRVARTTPTKVGQFVTVWQREPGEPIRPFDVRDPVDLIVISCRDGGGFGQFVFPRAVLGERGVLSREGAGGKRALRVYPPWVTTSNRQAGSSQAWQLKHFLPLPGQGPADAERVRAYYLRAAPGTA
ncbi:MepB family protein [Kitasatospora sp. NPDC050543]|uniref:MepB family protein n=1 Tax=Kitasatospora sp. NPDC050543 TaxID=3364054 RepID=UPI0037B762E6